MVDGSHLAFGVAGPVVDCSCLVMETFYMFPLL